MSTSFKYRTIAPDHSTCKRNYSFNLPNSNQRKAGVEALVENRSQVSELGAGGPARDLILVLVIPGSSSPFLMVTHILSETHLGQVLNHSLMHMFLF
jgi:hypothetical protein